MVIVVSNIVQVSINKIVLWISVGLDRRTAERAIISSNGMILLCSCSIMNLSLYGKNLQNLRIWDNGIIFLISESIESSKLGKPSEWNWPVCKESCERKTDPHRNSRFHLLCTLESKKSQLPSISKVTLYPTKSNADTPWSIFSWSLASNVE